ncbi:MAG: flagellar hook-length control protein FliK [Bacillota bacterium]|nr:flagellar hook-length control protein FliK [Bacillota bacterium]
MPLSQAGLPPPSTELYQRQAVRDGTVRELTPLPDPLPAADETPEQAGREPLLSAPSQGKVDLSALLKGAAGSEQAHLFREHRSGSQEGGDAFPWTAVWLRAGQPEAEAAAKVDLQPLQLPSHHRLAGEEPLAEKVLSQLIHRASVLLREGGSEMRLQLIPESLGRVAMHIAVEHGTVTARFAVANEQVKNLIEAQLPQLRQALEEQGLRVDSFSVSCQLGGEERPWPGQEQVATQGWTPGSEGKRAEQAYESSGRSVALVRQGTGFWGAEGVIDALV